MKTALLAQLAAASALAENIVEQPHIWSLSIPFPSASTVFESTAGLNLPNWAQVGPEQFPGAQYDQGSNALSLVATEKPSAVNVIRRDYDGTTLEWTTTEPFDIEWVDMGIYDPMIEATATITRLQETEVVLREEITRQANRIVALEAEILRLNTAIDAAQNPPSP
jgi:hypothetical protein